MDNPEKCIKLINFFITKRDNKIRGVQGYNSNFEFTLEELQSKTGLAFESSELENILKIMSGDSVYIEVLTDIEKMLKTIIKEKVFDYKKTEDQKYIIENSSTDKLKKYKRQLEIDSRTPRGAYDRPEYHYPYPLPENIKWGKIKITFLNKEDVVVEVEGNPSLSCNYSGMGFYNEKLKCFTVQWKLLYKFADHNGSLLWENVEEHENGKKISFVTMKKRLQFLTEQLQSYFRMSEDPFMTDERNSEYIAKFNVEIKNLRNQSVNTIPITQSIENSEVVRNFNQELHEDTESEDEKFNEEN